MTRTQYIPAGALLDLDVREGDTLHVIARQESSFLVEVSRGETPSQTPGKASEWLRTARGSVRLEENETPDDVRMNYYSTKYNPRQQSADNRGVRRSSSSFFVPSGQLIPARHSVPGFKLRHRGILKGCLMLRVSTAR